MIFEYLKNYIPSLYYILVDLKEEKSFHLKSYWKMQENVLIGHLIYRILGSVEMLIWTIYVTLIYRFQQVMH